MWTIEKDGARVFAGMKANPSGISIGPDELFIGGNLKELDIPAIEEITQNPGSLAMPVSQESRKTGGGLATAPLSLRVLAGLLFDDSEVFNITMEQKGVDVAWNENLRFDLLRLEPKNGGCGWDNSTLFDEGVPLKTPDLATWLVIQQEWLARTAAKLGKAEEVEAWSCGAKALLGKMLERFWTGDAFVARLMGSDKPVASNSLQLKIPLLLGHRLPEETRQWCLDGLLDSARYWTSFGLRSEPLDSEKFSADGYWRGAVWPVTVFIFVEALRVNGFEKEANLLIDGYLKHVEEAGNFENYRGDNGIGVRDTHFAWTATCVVHFLKLRN